MERSNILKWRTGSSQVKKTSSHRRNDGCLGRVYTTMSSLCPSVAMGVGLLWANQMAALCGPINTQIIKSSNHASPLIPVLFIPRALLYIHLLQGFTKYYILKHLSDMTENSQYIFHYTHLLAKRLVCATLLFST